MLFVFMVREVVPGWSLPYFIRSACRFILWFVEKLRSDPALANAKRGRRLGGAGAVLFGTDAASLLWNPYLWVRLMVAVPHGRSVGGVEENPRIDRCDVIIAKELIIIVPVALLVKGQSVSPFSAI